MVVVWIVASVIFVVLVTARYASLLRAAVCEAVPRAISPAPTLSPPRLNGASFPLIPILRVSDSLGIPKSPVK